MKPIRVRALVCLVEGILILAVALVVTEVWQYSRNSLLENRNWVSTKNWMDIAPMGSSHFLLTRHALQGNRLNLHAWHGYNEVHLDRVFSLGLIEADVKLSKKAHLSIIFNRSDTGFDGIRLSRNPRLPGMYFHADREGRFEKKVPLPDLDVDAGWYPLRLDFRGGSLVARVGERRIEVAGVAPLDRQFVGFRCGLKRCLIDNVNVTDAGDSIVISESFRNLRGRGSVFLAAFSGGVAVALVFALIGMFRDSGREAAFAFSSMMLTLLAVASMYYIFDLSFWSRQYSYYTGFTPHGRFNASPLSRMEIQRRRFFGTDFDRDSGRERTRTMDANPLIFRAVATSSLHERLPDTVLRYTSSRNDDELTYVHPEDFANLPSKKEGDIRLVFIGSSQTFGSGVELETDRYVDRVHREMSSMLRGRIDVDTFNISHRGFRSDQLFEEYEERWVGVSPDLVVIDLSYNDQNAPDTLAKSLRKFVALNGSKGIETVFVVEPSGSGAWGNSHLSESRDAMRMVAAELGIVLIDLSSHMDGDAVRDSGFLWWDNIHMTSLGHEKASAFMLKYLGPLVESLAVADATQTPPPGSPLVSAP